MKIQIFDIDNWLEIGATLSRNKTRTFLTAFGIFWGTAMLAMLFGGSKGLEDVMGRNFEGFATNSAIIFGGRTTMPYQGFIKGTPIELTTVDVENITHNVPGIKALASTQSNSAVASYGKKNSSTTVKGIDENFSLIMLPLVYEGRFISKADNINERKVCVIGKRVAGDLFGSESPLGRFVAMGGIYYRVVGVAGQSNDINMDSKIDESVLIPATTMRKAYNLGNKAGVVMMLVNDGVSPTTLKPRIEHELRKHHPIHPDDHNALFLFDVSEKFQMVDNLFMGITVLALFVGVGTLLAGVIGVGNIMWVIVKERTQEIGIRRAIGARPSDIVVQILLEGMTLTFIAGMAGICFAAVVLGVAQYILTVGDSVPHFQLQFDVAVYIMMIFMTLGTAAGLIPAMKAMKIKPIEALNDK